MVQSVWYGLVVGLLVVVVVAAAMHIYNEISWLQ